MSRTAALPSRPASAAPGNPPAAQFSPPLPVTQGDGDSSNYLRVKPPHLLTPQQISKRSQRRVFYSRPLHAAEAQEESFSCKAFPVPSLARSPTASHSDIVLSQVTARVQRDVRVGKQSEHTLPGPGVMLLGFCGRDGVTAHTTLQQSSHSEICFRTAAVTPTQP